MRSSLARAFGAIGSGVAIAGAVRTIARFEQSMSSVRAVTGATEQQFGSLEREARRLGATTRFSASQAAEGMLFLARAGFDVNEVMSSVEGTLRLAQAGALELGRAADIASNILTGFRLNVDQTGRVVDVLALAANSANTSVEQMGEAMKFVAPVAAGVGVSVEEAAAAIGALSDAGLQGSLAGTGLRRVLAELESPAAKTAQILTSLGLTADEVRVSQVGLTNALIALRDAGVDTGLALEIFGDRGGPAFEVLANSIPKVQELTGSLQNAGGTAARMAEIMDDNLNGALLAVRSALEAVVLSFGELGASNVLTQGLRATADALRFLARNVDLAATAAIALAGALVAPRILAAAAALRALGASGFTAAAGLTAATRAARLLGRALLIGFAIEGIQAVINEYQRLNRVVETTPQTWGDAAQFAVDRFVNTLIGGFVGLGRSIYNIAALITDPLAAAFIAFGDAVPDLLFGSLTTGDAVTQIATATSQAFGAALRRIPNDFQEDLNRVYIGIATEAQRAAFGRLGELSRQLSVGLETSYARLGRQIAAFRRDVASGTDAQERAVRLTAEQTEELDKLRSRLDPLGTATRELARHQELLALAQRAGNITVEEATRLNARLADEYERQTNPLRELRDELDTLTALRGVGIGEIERERRVLDIVNRARQQGVEINDEFVTSTRDLVEQIAQQNDALEREGRLYRELQGPAVEYQANLDALNRVVAQYPELAGQAAAAHDRLRLTFLASQTDFASGVEAALLRASMSFESFGQLAGEAVIGWVRSAEDAFVQFVQTGKFSFRELTDAIIADLARIAWRKLITEPLVDAITGAVGSIRGGGGGGLIGGIIGSITGGGGILGNIFRGVVGGFGSVIDAVGSFLGFRRGGFVPARVSNGEYLVPPGPAQRHAGLLGAINGGLPGYQEGGEVAASASSALDNLTNSIQALVSALATLDAGDAITGDRASSAFTEAQAAYRTAVEAFRAISQLSPTEAGFESEAAARAALTPLVNQFAELARSFLGYQNAVTEALHRGEGLPEEIARAQAEALEAHAERFNASFDILSRPDFRADRAIGGATARIGPDGNLTSQPPGALETIGSYIGRGIIGFVSSTVGNMVFPGLGSLASRVIDQEVARSQAATLRGVTAEDPSRTGGGILSRIGDFFSGIFGGGTEDAARDFGEALAASTAALDAFEAANLGATTTAHNAAEELAASIAAASPVVDVFAQELAATAPVIDVFARELPENLAPVAAAMDETAAAAMRAAQAFVNEIELDMVQSARAAAAGLDAHAVAIAGTVSAADELDAALEGASRSFAPVVSTADQLDAALEGTATAFVGATTGARDLAVEMHAAANGIVDSGTRAAQVFDEMNTMTGAVSNTLSILGRDTFGLREAMADTRVATSELATEMHAATGTVTGGLAAAESATESLAAQMHEAANGIANSGQAVVGAHETVAAQAHLAAAGLDRTLTPQEQFVAAMDRTVTNVANQNVALAAHAQAINDATASTRAANDATNSLALAIAQGARASLAAADAAASAARGAASAAGAAHGAADAAHSAGRAAHDAALDAFEAANFGGGSDFGGGNQFGVGPGEDVGVFAAGGVIRGPGTGTSDSILGAFPAGSFIVNARATRRHRGLLDAIAGRADGGYVGARVSNGEYFIGPALAARFGGLLHAINDDTPAYQTGGSIRAPAPRVGGGNVIVNVHNSPRTEADVRQRRLPNGDVEIDVMVEDIVDDAIDRGRFDRPLSRRYGSRARVA